jgi:RNA polymerase sigma factor (TIGR02999 family)
MGAIDQQDVAHLWDDFARGSAAATDRLLAAHYDEFRHLARRVLNGDAVKLQLQPTELAHEAAIRVLKLDHIDLRGRTHFLALSARVMRQTLMDEVRRHRAAKRQAPPVTMPWMFASDAPRGALDLEAFDAALSRLASIDADLAELVEQRFFAGLTVEEIAAETRQSESTVKRRWRAARAWLVNELGPG